MGDPNDFFGYNFNPYGSYPGSSSQYPFDPSIRPEPYQYSVTQYPPYQYPVSQYPYSQESVNQYPPVFYPPTFYPPSQHIGIENIHIYSPPTDQYYKPGDVLTPRIEQNMDGYFEESDDSSTESDDGSTEGSEEVGVKFGKGYDYTPHFPTNVDLKNTVNESTIAKVLTHDEYITTKTITTATTTTTSIATWPWFVFLAGAMGCLILSSISHLFACHSRRFSLFFWRLDYAGISLMIVGSFFPPLYYVFSCNHLLRLFYLTAISLLGLLTIFTLLAPSLSAPRFRSLRAALFLALGLSGMVPTTHAVVMKWRDPRVLEAAGYEAVVAALYSIGVGFYVSRVPERWRPGAFDIAGHSHQIFHVFVVAAALTHSAAALYIMDWRRGLPPCSGP